jgi:hypothetical protein
MNAVGLGMTSAKPTVILPTVVVSMTSSPFIAAYPWSSTSGYGAKYANPASLPSSASRALSFTAAGSNIIGGTNNTPFVYAYPFTNGTGFGTKYADLASSPPNGTCYAIATSGTTFAWGGAGGVKSYNFSDTAGFGTYKNQDLTTVGIYSLKVIPSSASVGAGYLLAGYDATSWLRFFSGGTNLTGSGGSISSTGKVTGIDYDVINNRVAIAANGATGVAAFPFTGGSFGTKLTNPTTMPTGTISYGITFSPNYDYLIVLNNNSSGSQISTYAWNGSFGTKQADPTTPLNPTVPSAVKFSKDGLSVHLTRYFSPNIVAYRWSNGFGTRYTDLTTTGGQALDISFN